MSFWLAVAVVVVVLAAVAWWTSGRAPGRPGAGADRTAANDASKKIGDIKRGMRW